MTEAMSGFGAEYGAGPPIFAIRVRMPAAGLKHVKESLSTEFAELQDGHQEPPGLCDCDFSSDVLLITSFARSLIAGLPFRTSDLQG
jgi:hypothetical protein